MRVTSLTVKRLHIVKIELFYFQGCPHAGAARALLARCLGQLALDVSVIEIDGRHPSPTIRIDGRDVMGEPASREPSCRLDVPTEARLVAALQAATRQPG